ncbi:MULTISPECIES: response regulator [unclassified Sphingopyxis]|uniref:sigma-54-dependent transcriptional regulator n=1 Tax=unclassified Sphingopyxis TaxID=2614943 RepID=UPI002859D816|nr:MULTISPECIES: response regulator [unclassified Sphingopyxis]MDR6832975.1 two-component system C4-dicarboxylate transport response regulator DctD [Sphingopyxis sp. BE122]MDR7228718.1 two-component system C4-dicarboxylate transport response regulator DctD [Sphingopyxis sp. BE259]
MIEDSISVIFVEDDESLRAGTVQALQMEGFAVAAFPAATAALREVNADFDGVVVSDVRLPVLDGIEFFARIRQIDPDIPVIFTTAHGDVSMAVNSMKDGAADFFTKPYSIERLARSVRQAADRRRLLLENRRLRSQLEGSTRAGWMGSSAVARRTERMLQDVAQTDADLLISGAPGIGKSHVARLVHDLSPRRNRPFVILDPGVFANEEANVLVYGRDPSVALSRSGMIERAAGGTLVIEAVESITARDRPRLVNLVDHRNFIALGAERPKNVDIRIIGTTTTLRPEGEDLASRDRGLEDRLSGITVTLPRLVERRDDIPELFHMFVAEFERSLERTAADLTEIEWHHLVSHDWPGNLRELRTFAQNFVLGLTRLAQPAVQGAMGASLHSLVANFERTLLEDAMKRAGGSVTEVQRNLKIPRKTLYDKLAKHGLQARKFRA